MAKKEYIEREALYQFCKDQLEEETGAYSKGRNAGLRVTMSAVMNNDAIPAADVRPVRHGRWTHGEGDSRWMCSVCKGIENTRLVSKCSACGYQTIDHRNYCPNCGADMREG